MQKEQNPIGFNTQAVIDANGKQRPILIQQLHVRPINRKSQDIASMLTAIRSAEAISGRRTELYDMYEDFLSSDGHLLTVHGQRILNVTNVDWTYLDKDGNEVPHIKEWIDTPDFELVISEILNSKFWGYTMLEIEFFEDGTFTVYLVPRKHMRPSKGLITTEQTGDNGVFIREGIYADTILEAGKEKDLGLFMTAASYVIFKRGSISDWAQFAEVFGQPLIDAVWDGFDENQRELLLEAIDNLGSGGRIVRPEGTQLNMVQGGANNPNGALYEGIYRVCNAELSKMFLGQTETTESSDSSGYAQASVHADTKHGITKDDLKFVRRILNKRLQRIFEKNGFAPAGGRFSVVEEQSTVPLPDQLNNDIRLKNEVGLPMTDDHFYEKYGVKKPDNYDQLKAEQAAKKAEQQMGGFNMSQMFDTLLKLRDSGFFLRAPKATGANIKKSLRTLYLSDACCTRNVIKLADGGPINEDFIKKIFQGELKNNQVDEGYYFDVAQKLSDAIAKGIGVKSFSVTDPKVKLYEKFKNNVYAFSAAKSLTALQEYQKSLFDEKGQPVSYNKFRSAVTETDKEFNDVYLKSEYDSAVAKAQMGQKWQKLQQYDMLKYRTVGDSKVRKGHAKLDGLILASNDPLWAKIYPPNDWGCRCTVIPAQGATQSNREKAAEFANGPALKPYFSQNSGIDHVAFNEDEHPYFERVKSLKNGQTKQVELMAEENYSLHSVEQIMKQADLPEFELPKSKTHALESWNEVNKTITCSDGMEWDFSDRWQHIVEDHPDQDRWKYINQVPNILSDADEVWLTKQMLPDGKIHTYKRYIKYYKGRPLVLSYPVDAPEGWTVYSSDVDETGTYKKMRDVARRGILVKRK